MPYAKQLVLKNNKLLLLVLLLVFSLSLFIYAKCNPSIVVSSNFESANIKEATAHADDSVTLVLGNDNDDSSLPNFWRSWWYVRLDKVPINAPIKVRISNRGWPQKYLPVFSYDQTNWERVAEGKVAIDTQCNQPICDLIFEFISDKETVYLARHFPYSHNQLNEYLRKLKEYPFVTISSLGKTPKYQLDIPLVTIKPRVDVADSSLHPIWVHARTHPGETGGSYVIEGLINRIIKDFPNNTLPVIWYIVPMHNIDGVIDGYYRGNAAAVDLESAFFIDKEVPAENAALIAAMQRVIDAHGLNTGVAFNIHSANTDLKHPFYLISHFGSSEEFYSAPERTLFYNQLALVSKLKYFSKRKFKNIHSEGDYFLKSAFPETWWWLKAQDKMTAVTLELTYDNAGGKEPIRIKDLEKFGSSLVDSSYSILFPEQ